jgi:hypothetical protein
MILKGKKLSKIIPKMKINLEKYSEIISKDKKLISRRKGLFGGLLSHTKGSPLLILRRLVDTNAYLNPKQLML